MEDSDDESSFLLDEEGESSSSVDDPTPIKRVKVGKKLEADPREWNKNFHKEQRAAGKAYLKKTKDGDVVVKGKKFTCLNRCCPKQCYKNILAIHQEQLYDNFYALGSKGNQDLYLSSCMYDKEIKTRRVDETCTPRECLWEYSINVPELNTRTLVCRQFLLSLFQVTARRFRTIQNKLKVGSLDFSEKRGKHANRPHKIDDTVWSLVKEHWSTMPSTPSHYSANKSKRLYFDNTELTITKLFSMFKEFYQKKTGQPVPMKYNTYFQFFRKNSAYSIRMPRTDTCDFCETMKIKLQLNPDDREIQTMKRLHEKKVAGYKTLKAEVLRNAKSDNTSLVLEFDYGQNLPLPRLTVNKLFYKRQLWYYAFNIHCHNDDVSTMYTYLETEGTKDTNTVASFLFDFISKKIEKDPTIKEIILLSDNCGGQNKNVKMMMMCSFMAVKFKVKLLHIYPVRGHSYCQCDRNFGAYSNSIKRTERITSNIQYDVFISSKATVVQGHALLRKWSYSLEEYFTEYKNLVSRKAPFKIQQYCRLQYTASGTVLAASTYCGAFTPFNFILKGKNFAQFQVQSVPHVERTVLKPAKEKDIRSLFPYLTPEEQEWFNAVIEKPKEVPNAEVNDGDEDVEDDVSDHENIHAYEFPDKD